VLAGRLVKGDLSDPVALGRAIREFRPDAVIHFAASIQVEESVRKPLLYYGNNVTNSLNLLDAMIDNDVNVLVYSSTAAVYGIPEKMPVHEGTELRPINPYGASKAMMERVLADLALSRDFSYVALRYFNVAGADPDGAIGQAYREATHLITRALKTARGELERLFVFGTDYPTPDGTCVRDYIHVNDLGKAHLHALDYLRRSRENGQMNCGYGHGFSVKEVVEAVKRVTGVDFKVEEAKRRPGDPPALIADSTLLRSKTGWAPQHDDLDFIVKTAWDWELKLSTLGNR